MKHINLITFITFLCLSCNCQSPPEDNNKNRYETALVSYSDYEKLVNEVKFLRANNLISFDQLLELKKDTNTLILDTRSKDKYEAKHISGAINLPFTEFTQGNLKRIIPDINTRIIIYCNNNFKGDQILFASKTFDPEVAGKKTMIASQDTIMLALNIPTYINLYGYGYRNILELNELVNINDPRLILVGNNGLKSTNIINNKLDKN